MKLLNIPVRVLSWLFAVMLGLGLIAFGFNNEKAMAFLQANAEFFVIRLCIGVAGIAVIVIEVFWILSKLSSGGTSRNISFDTGHGEVEVSIPTIETCIRRVIEKIEDVYAVSVAIEVPSSRRAPVVCNLKTTVSSGVDLPQKISAIQEVVREKFQELLKGVDREITPRVQVKLMDSRKSNPSSAQPAEHATDVSGQDDFRGPEYPVDDM